ncbi:hypothetical protein G6O67_001578 [Ophiocordyceps sinensis]|uniref:Uncharacterized protein n=1 Tax=Ophiocordyceps sinensis TaxID=72228 RepID=A0A8H4PXY1_9HYPO|nr:hypothetical protein G6O67_001578 [Ophiocordyceps sinensis]
MSSAAVSAPAGVEPNHHQPPSVSPNPASAPLADDPGAPVALASPQPNGFDLLGLGLLQQPTASPAGSLTRSPSQGNSQGPVSDPPPMGPPNNGQPPSLPSDGSVMRPSPRPQHTPSIAPQAPGRPAGHLRSPKTANSRLELTSEYFELAEVVKRTSPQVVRQVVRDLWEKCLLGSEYHLAFLSYACFHQASPSTLERAVQDFGDKMVKASKRHIMAHLAAEDFDEVADVILAKVSNDFLDNGMARRLETIRARQLVNALARAERLGYDVQDIVEEKTANGAEHVVPSLGPMTALALPLQPASSQPPKMHPAPAQPQTPVPLPRRPVSGALSTQTPTPTLSDASLQLVVYCPKCDRPCSGEQALRYHSLKRACEYTRKIERLGKDICNHCGCLFISSGGLLYHVKSKVCGDFPESVGHMIVHELQAKYSGSSAATKATPSATRAPAGTPASSQRKTPGQLGTATASNARPFSPATSSRDYASPADDPYAKLGVDERRRFELEMQKAEDHYGGLMREAMKLPAPQREHELSKLKNSYNSKQSVTRKKFGIRLRERRSKAEIESERLRLAGVVSPSDGHARPPKRPRFSEMSSASRGPESPAAAVSGLNGGLAGSTGTAEHTDPTTLLRPSQPRSVAQVAQPSATKGTPDDPMQIDDDSNDETDSDSDDEDIPAH